MKQSGKGVSSTHVQVRRHAIGEPRVVRIAGEGGYRASLKRILVLRAFVLPVVPDFVNHLHGDNVMR